MKKDVVKNTSKNMNQVDNNNAYHEKKSKINRILHKNKLYYFVFTIFLLITVIGVVCVMLFSKDTNSVMDIITLLTALIGVVSVYIEYRNNKALVQTNNLIVIYSDFNDISTNREIQYKLEVLKRRNVNLFTEDDIPNIRIYLKFFEGIAPMFIKDVVSFKKINSILGYRFFLIMNSPYIQNLEIIPRADNYKGCITMHYLWSEWCKKNNFVRSGDKFSLEKNFKEYYDYVIY